MSFKEKQSAITLLALWIVAIASGGQMIHATPATMHEAAAHLVRAVVALIAIMTLSNATLIVGAGRREAAAGADERDRMIGLTSQRNGLWIAATGLFGIVALALRSAGPVQLAEAAAAALWLVEMTVHASRLYYFKRGL